jgi:hypothetical protein
LLKKKQHLLQASNMLVVEKFGVLCCDLISTPQKRRQNPAIPCAIAVAMADNNFIIW